MTVAAVAAVEVVAVGVMLMEKRKVDVESDYGY